MSFIKRYEGIIIAWAIILIWSGTLILLLQSDVEWRSPYLYFFILIQTHLYTGLFITGHDAMHGSISRHKKINSVTGIISIGLFAFNSYWRLFPKHHRHHRHVGSEGDPDFYNGPFLMWYFKFLTQYVTIWQLILMALTYNALILIFPVQNVILFWIVPSLLSTLQLFYFGTYLPHKGEHDPGNIHKSRTQKKNHLIAFLTCYFFGYHYEHHDMPHVPWWQLYKQKE